MKAGKTVGQKLNIFFRSWRSTPYPYPPPLPTRHLDPGGSSVSESASRKLVSTFAGLEITPVIGSRDVDI
jgi:hypothetical protein